MNKSEIVQNYFKNPAISQSQIKGILKGPHLLKVLDKNPNYFEESEGMLMGSLVDDMFTYSPAELSEIYHVGEIENKPSDVIVSIIRQTFDNRINDNINDNMEFVLQYAKEHNYGNGKYKDETIINTILKSESYWNDLLQIGNKTLVSLHEYNLATLIRYNIENHEYTKDIFADNHRFQTDLYFKQDGFDCKALLDLITYNKERNAICPFDFKMTGYNTLFKIPFNKFFYMVQAEWYTNAIYANRDHIAELFNIDNTFIVDPFKFIVESVNNPGTPLIYELKLETIVDAQLMIKEGLDLYRWHSTNNIWNLSKEVVINKGRFKI